VHQVGNTSPKANCFVAGRQSPRRISLLTPDSVRQLDDLGRVFSSPGASIPPNTLEQGSPSLPLLLPLPPPLPSPPSLPLPLEVAPLIAARWSGAALYLPQRVRAEPGRQTVFGEFQAKNIASTSNDLQELFGK